MRRLPLTAAGAAVLLGTFGWAGLAGAQLTTAASTPEPQAVPTPIAPPRANPSPPAPGSVVVRMNGSMTTVVGVVSDSGRQH